MKFLFFCPTSLETSSKQKIMTIGPLFVEISTFKKKCFCYFALFFAKTSGMFFFSIGKDFQRKNWRKNDFHDFSFFFLIQNEVFF